MNLIKETSSSQMYRGTFEWHRLVKTGTSVCMYDVVQTHKRKMQHAGTMSFKRKKNSSCYIKCVLTIGVFAFEEF
jgi:hypothetical protein